MNTLQKDTVDGDKIMTDLTFAVPRNHEGKPRWDVAELLPMLKRMRTDFDLCLSLQRVMRWKYDQLAKRLPELSRHEEALLKAQHTAFHEAVDES